MSTHTTFANPSRLPVGGSQYPIGTAFLRYNPGDASFNGSALIAVGNCESISLKSTGEEMELEDEEGATEAWISLNNGEEASLTCRFTKDVPTPRKGMMVAITRRKSTLSMVTSGLFTDAAENVSFFLITAVSEDYGSKAVAKYTLTAKRWESLDGVSPKTAVVTTATGAIVSSSIYPELP